MLPLLDAFLADHPLSFSGDLLEDPHSGEDAPKDIFLALRSNVRSDQLLNIFIIGLWLFLTENRWTQPLHLQWHFTNNSVYEYHQERSAVAFR